MKKKMERKTIGKIAVLVCLGMFVLVSLSVSVLAQSWGTTVNENASYRISIDDDGTSSDEVFAVWEGVNDGGAGGSELFRIQEDGNVGIGTTGPDAILDILGTTTQLRLTYTDGTYFTDFTTGSAGDLIIQPSNSRVGINVVPENNLDLYGNMAIGTSYAGSCSAPGDGLIVEGDVGIGTHSPATRLHVTTDLYTANVPLIAFDRTTDSPANNDSYDIDFKHENDNSGQVGFAQITLIAEDITNGEEGGSLAFSVADGDDGSMDEAMRIIAGGNVGIGTTAPKGALNVDNTGESKGLGVSFDTYHFQTTDADPIIMASICTETDKAYALKVTIIAIKSDASKVNHYIRYLTYRNDGGTLDEVNENSGLTYEDDGSWDISIDPEFSGTDIEIEVTGGAFNVEWQATVQKHIVGV